VLRRAAERVNAASEQVNEYVRNQAASILDDDKVPGIVGGEHSVPFGAIRACAERFGEIGVLHVDAHMDLRREFEGFRWSHASIMHNVLTRVPGVVKVVQVGVRDFGEGEMQFADEAGARIRVVYDDVIAEQQMRGTAWPDLCASIVQDLPDLVYVSFDIDGLDPSLCPHTGTPVPGGLSFNQAVLLLDVLRGSGKRVVGFDLVEVAPGPRSEPEWDANVGARVLYRLCGLA
jgi:agmatinase